MVDPSTLILTDIAIILIIGIALSLLAKRINISNILLLVLAGIGLGVLAEGSGHFMFSDVFLVSIGMFTLCIIVFNGSSKFSLRELDHFSSSVLKFIIVFVFTNILIVTPVVALLFFGNMGMEAILFSILFAVLMVATDSGTVFTMLKGKHRVVEFLDIESLLNDPFTVVLPFIVFSIIKNVEGATLASAVASQVLPFLQQIIVGIGAGLVIGYIMVHLMRKFYSQQYSPVGIIAATLLAYIIADNLNGNGVMAVATLGVIFGNNYIKGKDILQGFNEILDSTFVIIVFILIGVIVKIDFSSTFLLKAFAVFFVMVITRFLALLASLHHTEFILSEKVYMALNMPKGIAAAVVAFSLAVFSSTPDLDSYMDIIMQLVLITMVYSILVSTLVTRFGSSLLSSANTQAQAAQSKTSEKK